MSAMTAPTLHRDLNREAFLWYTLTSPDYLDQAFEQLRQVDAFLKDQVKAHPTAKDFGPAAYWGGMITQLLDTYPNARAMLAHGEFATMREWCIQAGSIDRGFREQAMWMSKDDFVQFLDLIDEASSVASNYIRAIEMIDTFSGENFLDGTDHWSAIDQDQGFPGANILLKLDYLHADHIPEYSIDSSLACRSGDIVPWTGVWIPADGIGTAALAFARQGQLMQPKYPVTHVDEYGYEHTKPVETYWHPVKPTGRMLPVNSDAPPGDPLRVPAGKSATQSGYWFTPAKQGSRRHFKRGEVFPEVEGNSYGATFWQWSPDQSNPKL